MMAIHAFNLWAVLKIAVFSKMPSLFTLEAKKLGALAYIVTRTFAKGTGYIWFTMAKRWPIVFIIANKVNNLFLDPCCAVQQGVVWSVAGLD